MTPDETLPSYHLRMLRYTATELLKPGRVLSDMMVATVIASINTCAAIADDYEEDTAILRKLWRVTQRPEGNGQSRPTLRLITCGPDDGGSAA
ncbi:hypothetical protein DEM27_33070 [Metarhizobium album]|uniref:Uncharacterized protein n=1 Tax=Metarhizobium album TaxID=2182425 RepID=A0A2U2DFI0_9HYPH|nr:hypothetical protein [Rhizobium album]PWE52050.1 hypothetical protein DEM27_33070 [Rhizobium album]